MSSGRPDDVRPREPVRMEERQTSASVWNAIRYLDSSSNYREYLFCAERQASLEENELIFLDDFRKDYWIRLRNVSLTAGFACLALLLALQS